MIIELTRGFSTVIDDVDFERPFGYFLPDGVKIELRVCDLKWHTHTPPHTQYARAGYGRTPRHFIQLHRLLTECPLGMIADHEDRNGLNNQRYNLRVVTPHQSRLNTGKQAAKNKYRGVYWNKKEQRWYARITNAGQTLWLGSFTDEVAAALAYNEAAQRLHGEFAQLNVLVRQTQTGQLAEVVTNEQT